MFTNNRNHSKPFLCFHTFWTILLCVYGIPKLWAFLDVTFGQIGVNNSLRNKISISWKNVRLNSREFFPVLFEKSFTTANRKIVISQHQVWDFWEKTFHKNFQILVVQITIGWIKCKILKIKLWRLFHCAFLIVLKEFFVILNSTKCIFIYLTEHSSYKRNCIGKYS